MNNWWENLVQGCHETAQVGKQLLAGNQGLCIEILGSAPVDQYPELVPGLDALVKGATRLGASVLISGPANGRNFARRAAETAELEGGRAIIIESSHANLEANRNGFPVHVACPSPDGRRAFLTNELCRHGITVVLPGGSDVVFPAFSELVHMRTGRLPSKKKFPRTGHQIFVVGEPGELIAEAIRDTERRGMFPTEELDWLIHVDEPGQILPFLQSSAKARHRAQRRFSQNRDVEMVEKYLALCLKDIAELMEAVDGHEDAIAVYGSGKVKLPAEMEAEIRTQLGELLKRLPLAVKHGGFSGIMKLAAEIAHRLTVSIAIRARIEGRKQPTNKFHSRLAWCVMYWLREAGLLGPSNTIDIFYPGGSGSLREVFNHHGRRRILVNIDKFWEPVRRLLDYMVARGFMRHAERELFVFVNHPLDAV